MIDKKLLIRRLSLTVYFFAAFFVFLLLLFPFDRVKLNLESAVRQHTPFDLSVGRISPQFFNRFVFTDVVVSDKAGKVLFESPSIKTTLSLWNLLRRLLVLDMKAQAYGGELSIKTRQGPGKASFVVDANGLELGSYGWFREAGLKLSGKLGGNLDFVGDSGKGRLVLKGFGWRELKVKGFPLPDLDFDQGWLEADIRGDRISIRKMEFDGKDLSIRCLGDAVLRDRGPLNLTVKLKPSERLAREQSGILSLLTNKDPDGYYQFVLGGTLTEPLPRL